MTSNATVSDAAAQKYYNQNKSTFTTPETREVRHILVNNKALGEKIEKEVKNGGNFAQLAKKYSKDPGSASQGGKLCVAHGGTSGACQQTVPPFDKAAFGAQDRTRSRLVHSQFGWHVIQPIGAVSPAHTQTFQQVKTQIQQNLSAQQKQTAWTAWLAELAKDFKGKVIVPDGLHAGDDDRVRDDHWLMPPPTTLGAPSSAEALLSCKRLTERLRRDCPWDREQTAQSIVPHTVEEAYEVADAALAGDDAKLLDELGDLLFQVYFLALLLEERGAGDLAQVARGVHEKLVRRHPHVFGDVEAETAERVRSNWERIKVEQEGREGIFHDVAEGLPGLLYARKTQQRAKAVGFEYPDLAGAIADLADELRELEEEPSGDELGDVLFAAVNVARKLEVDPELEVRRAAQRFRRRVETLQRSSRRRAARIGASCRSSGRTRTSTRRRRTE